MNDWENKETCSLDFSEKKKGMTLEQVSQLFNVTRERARQIENSALQNIKTLLEDRGLNKDDVQQALAAMGSADRDEGYDVAPIEAGIFAGIKEAANKVLNPPHSAQNLVVTQQEHPWRKKRPQVEENTLWEKKTAFALPLLKDKVPGSKISALGREKGFKLHPNDLTRMRNENGIKGLRSSSVPTARRATRKQDTVQNFVPREKHLATTPSLRPPAQGTGLISHVRGVRNFLRAEGLTSMTVNADGTYSSQGKLEESRT